MNWTKSRVYPSIFAAEIGLGEYVGFGRIHVQITDTELYVQCLYEIRPYINRPPERESARPSSPSGQRAATSVRR